jgi:ribosomal-protein-alanine N-acetyltransferase
MTPLETPRLILRPFTLDDADAFFRLGSDPEVTRYTHSSIANIDEARQLMESNPLRDYHKYGFGRQACVLKSSGEVIGFAGLKYLEDLDEVDLGYRFLPPYWGQGLAMEAAGAALRDGFARLKLSRVIGLVVPENIASVRVLTKLGMTFVGPIEFRGHPVAKYAIEKGQAENS